MFTALKHGVWKHHVKEGKSRTCFQLEGGVGPRDLQRSLPTLMILRDVADELNIPDGKKWERASGKRSTPRSHCREEWSGNLYSGSNCPAMLAAGPWAQRDPGRSLSLWGSSTSKITLFILFYLKHVFKTDITLIGSLGKCKGNNTFYHIYVMKDRSSLSGAPCKSWYVDY